MQDYQYQCQSIKELKDVGWDVLDGTFLCLLLKASDMIYSTCLARVQADLIESLKVD